MSDKFKYTTGLRNVGSYLAAGSPYVTSSTVSSGTEEEIAFPRVTDNISVKMDSVVYNSLFLSASDGGSLYYHSAASTTAADSAGRTLSVWISGSGQDSANPADNGIVVSAGINNTKMTIREKNTLLQFLVQTSVGVKIPFSAGGVVPTGWIHIAAVAEDNRAELYINGESKSKLTGTWTTIGADIENGLVVGAPTNFDGGWKFRDAIHWDAALSDAQVLALYQASGSYGDAAFSVANKIAWLKPTGADGLLAPPRLTNFKNTGDASIFTLQQSSSGEIIQISSDSPFAASSGGQLRVHYRSTGSLPNVANNKHYWTLSSEDEDIKMNIKTKEIYLSAVNGDCDFSIQADMTNIPAARMYQHTGSGVDE
jgi:hypothetical protein